MTFYVLPHEGIGYAGELGNFHEFGHSVAEVCLVSSTRSALLGWLKPQESRMLK